MSSGKKTSYSNEFKFKVAVDAIRGHKTIAELVIEHNVASSLISKWKKQLLDCGAKTFATGYTPQPESKDKSLYEQLGRQAMEIDYLKKCVGRYQ
jgi:transposase